MTNDSEPRTVTVGELRVNATVENLRKVSEFVRGLGKQLGLAEGIVFDIDLALEEAAANIVRHAYEPGRPGDLLVRVETIDGLLRITLTDWGIPLDPNKVTTFDNSASVETRARGGTGLHIIYGLMDEVSRKTALAPGGPNVLILSKQVER